MSTTDVFLAPVVTEVLLTAFARLRSDGPPAGLQIGSPWLSDVPLFPGSFASFSFLLPGVSPADVASLSNFIRAWVLNEGTATILVQSHDPKDWPKKTSAHFNNIELELLARCLEGGAEVLIGRRFHDKFWVVPDVVISGSANITYSGLYLNRERLSLYNRSSSRVDYETALAVCGNHTATAYAAGRCDPPRNPAGLADMRALSEIRRCYSASWK